MGGHPTGHSLNTVVMGVFMLVEDKWGESLTAGDVILSSDDRYYRIYAVGEDDNGDSYIVCRPLHQTVGLIPSTVEKVFGGAVEDYGEYYSEVDHV